jgi:hypothetical protein
MRLAEGVTPGRSKKFKDEARHEQGAAEHTYELPESHSPFVHLEPATAANRD